MATSNKTPVVIPQPIAAQATSENINAIPNGATGTNRASFQEGFPAITRMPVIENPLPTQVSGLPPKQQDFNGLFNVVSQHNFFAQNGGLYSFNKSVSDAIGGYAKNQILWYFPTNGLPVPVLSMIDNNTYNFAQNPSFIDGQKWRYFIPDSNLDHLSAAGQAKFDAKANVSNTVTTNTVQTITATKKMSGGTSAYYRPFEFLMPTSTESNPTENKAREIAFISSEGSGNNYEGSLAHMRRSDGSSYTGLRVGLNVNGKYIGSSLGVEINASGVAYGIAPETPYNASNSMIVTVGHLKNNYIDKTSTQTISGTKTFKSFVTAEVETVNFIAKNPTIDVNQTPSSKKYVGYDFRDKNNVRIGYIGISQGTDGKFRYELQNPGNYIEKITGITPPASSGGNEIVTAAWVNTKAGSFANTNASNFTATGKQTIVGWGIPDYSAGVSKALNTSITATRNCFVVVISSCGTNVAGLYVNDAKIGVGGNVYAATYVYLTAYVAKGQTYRTENVETYGTYVASVTEYPLIGG